MIKKILYVSFILFLLIIVFGSCSQIIKKTPVDWLLIEEVQTLALAQREASKVEEGPRSGLYLTYGEHIRFYSYEDFFVMDHQALQKFAFAWMASTKEEYAGFIVLSDGRVATVKEAQKVSIFEAIESSELTVDSDVFKERITKDTVVVDKNDQFQRADGQVLFQLTLEASPTESGSIQIDNQGWKQADQILISESQAVTLRAEAADKCVFKGWYRNKQKLDGANPFSLSINDDMTLEALFEPVQNQQFCLKDLGPEGNLINENETVYNIIDNTSLGTWSVSIRVSRLQEQLIDTGGWRLVMGESEYLFTQNPFVEDIYETKIKDDMTVTEDTIKNAFFEPIIDQAEPLTEKKENRRNAVSQVDWKAQPVKEMFAKEMIGIASVIIEKDPGENGTNLYRIGLDSFLSLRFTNDFVFDDANEFIPPCFVTNTEGNTYSLTIFLSARNATPDSSIGGTFEFLKALPEHSGFLENVNPNRVRVEQGEIIIDPPEDSRRKLRDLGPEGNLQEAGNVYCILDNTSVGYWSVFIQSSRLPVPEVNGSDWKLVFGQNEYPFIENEREPEIYQVNLPDSVASSIEIIRNAFFEVVEVIQEYTIEIVAAPPEGGRVSFDGSAWKAEDSKIFEQGVILDVHALAENGCEFLGWYQDGTKLSGVNPYQLTADSDRNIQALFLCESPSPTESVVSIHPVETTASGDFELSVNGQNLTNLLGFDLFIHYDHQAMYPKIEADNFIVFKNTAAGFSLLQCAIIEEGILKVSAGILTGEVSIENEIFLSLKFQAKDVSGTFSIEVDQENSMFINGDGEKLDVLFENGEIVLR